MNPIVHIKDNALVVYELIQKDLNKLRRAKIIQGGGDKLAALNHEVCIMQAVSMVTTQHEKDPSNPRFYDRQGMFYTDHPICVSQVITDFLISVNDNLQTDDARNKLKVLVKDIVNTCPVVLGVGNREKRGTKKNFPNYKEAELARKKLLEEHFYEPRWNNLRFSPNKARDLDKVKKVVREAAALYRTDQVEI